MIQLMSKWGKTVTAANVLPEYPRPNLVRDSFINLNGEWEYCINQEKTTNRYDGKILVPFSPETELSGVKKIVMPKDYLHYRKSFTIPEDFNKGRVLLHFGAVDQECTVLLNGNVLGEHIGGYTAFHFDITDYLVDGENILTLCVKDMTEEAPHARGKQKLVKKGKYGSLFYTPQSGIWETVWMESVSKDYIEKIKITPLLDDKAVRLNIKTNVSGTAKVRVLEQGNVVKEEIVETNKDVIIKLDQVHVWTPDDPYLYDLNVVFGEDEVQSYFGMRKFHVGKDSKGILRFFMNNKPFFFNGILDQGYWPESLLTNPTDEALKYDIIKLKELGFNTIRKHIKVEPDRFYYHCDKIGMIVWQDMPNGGGDYNMVFVTYLTNAFDWFARGVRDNLYGMFKRQDKEGRAQYYRDLEAMIEQLYNHPSIAVWVPFNEGWGQFDARRATALIRSLDKTRFVNEACGWFDQQGGDMYSIHNYKPGLTVKPQEDRVVALTEFGGYSYAMPGHLACEKEFGYQSYHSKEELTSNYKRLWENEIYPNLVNGLSSTIYTQTSDIEEEINGIFTYDRDEVKFVEDEVKEINKKLYRMFEDVV
ncbi:glycoside hydrolase family 2 protein [Clostridium porci]|uniref:Glycoside hydrolase family 2 n=1 Tax=Clostridium porci TaxID=2605778 RepID=A0A7X2NMV9_9CLOT|nr:sugar-binding domain-containing protein [Clostridium porci]MCI7181049.1 glycoside hydrolase family 2 [Lachnospiraceae bacterium]MSS37832.1 glycoside hydrolase family 2 [Clostridium porci]